MAVCGMIERGIVLSLLREASIVVVLDSQRNLDVVESSQQHVLVCSVVCA